jgi:hypothetical protein
VRDGPLGRSPVSVREDSSRRVQSHFSPDEATERSERQGWRDTKRPEFSLYLKRREDLSIIRTTGWLRRTDSKHGIERLV